MEQNSPPLRKSWVRPWTRRPEIGHIEEKKIQLISIFYISMCYVSRKGLPSEGSYR